THVRWQVDTHHRRLEERSAHALAEAGFLAMEDGRAHPERAQHARGEIEKGHAGPHGLAPRLAGDGHDAGEGLHERFVARRVLAGSGAAEGGDGAVDQPRVDGGERLVAKAEALHGARAEILDEHVGRAHEGLHHLHRLRRLEIELHAALVAVEEEVGGGFTVLVRRPRARLVAPPGVFDLDDVGAEVGEEGPAPWAGDDTREIDDTDAVEGEREGGHGGYYTAPRVTLQPLPKFFGSRRMLQRKRREGDEASMDVGGDGGARVRERRGDGGGREAL